MHCKEGAANLLLEWMYTVLTSRQWERTALRLIYLFKKKLLFEVSVLSLSNLSVLSVCLSLSLSVTFCFCLCLSNCILCVYVCVCVCVCLSVFLSLSLWWQQLLLLQLFLFFPLFHFYKYKKYPQNFCLRGMRARTIYLKIIHCSFLFLSA